MPDGDICRIDQYMIREKINALLNALYIPSRTELALLSELVRTMKAHCRLTYTSDRQFIQELYTAPEDRHIEHSLPICLTRSGERREGIESGSKCKSRWQPIHKK